MAIPAEIVQSTATFSDCGRYRYRLGRVWDIGRPMLPWVLLNGSVADAKRNDPTVVRVIGFTYRWGFGGLWLVNAYAAMATRPRDLFAMDDNIGEHNQHYVQRTIRDANRQWESLGRNCPLPIIVGWGNHGKRAGHDQRVMRWIRQAGPPVSVQCLGVTKQDCPLHPLYLRADARRVEYEGRPRIR